MWKSEAGTKSCGVFIPPPPPSAPSSCCWRWRRGATAAEAAKRCRELLEEEESETGGESQRWEKTGGRGKGTEEGEVGGGQNSSRMKSWRREDKGGQKEGKYQLIEDWGRKYRKGKGIHILHPQEFIIFLWRFSQLCSIR